MDAPGKTHIVGMIVEDDDLEGTFCLLPLDQWPGQMMIIAGPQQDGAVLRGHHCIQMLAQAREGRQRAAEADGFLPVGQIDRFGVGNRADGVIEIQDERVKTAHRLAPTGYRSQSASTGVA